MQGRNRITKMRMILNSDFQTGFPPTKERKVPAAAAIGRTSSSRRGKGGVRLLVIIVDRLRRLRGCFLRRKTCSLNQSRRWTAPNHDLASLLPLQNQLHPLPGPDVFRVSSESSPCSPGPDRNNSNWEAIKGVYIS
jgi:hypothetical protein